MDGIYQLEHWELIVRSATIAVTAFFTVSAAVLGATFYFTRETGLAHKPVAVPSAARAEAARPLVGAQMGSPVPA